MTAPEATDPTPGEWPACATYPNLGCVCRGALVQNKSTCTRKRTGDLAPIRTAAPTPGEVGLSEAEKNDLRASGSWPYVGTDIFKAVERVLAARTADLRAEHAAEVEALRLEVEVLSDWRYCPGCGRARDWSGETAPGAPCMGCGRYPARAEAAEAEVAELRAVVERVEALADEWERPGPKVQGTPEDAAAALRAALTAHRHEEEGESDG